MLSPFDRSWACVIDFSFFHFPPPPSLRRSARGRTAIGGGSRVLLSTKTPRRGGWSRSSSPSSFPFPPPFPFSQVVRSPYTSRQVRIEAGRRLRTRRRLSFLRFFSSFLSSLCFTFKSGGRRVAFLIYIIDFFSPPFSFSSQGNDLALGGRGSLSDSFLSPSPFSFPLPKP